MEWVVFGALAFACCVGLPILLQGISKRVLPPNQQMGDPCAGDRHRRKRPTSVESEGALEKMQELRRQGKR